MRPEYLVFATGSTLMCGSAFAQAFTDRVLVVRILLLTCFVGGVLISHAWKMRLEWGEYLVEERRKRESR